uniref:t-SNARE coiled-coil homology domain-containing protein n=1 Tax=Nothobranchius kuhntae TaxID=321403 RepID=A0A1A8JVR6_NOTKU
MLKSATANETPGRTLPSTNSEMQRLHNPSSDVLLVNGAVPVLQLCTSVSSLLGSSFIRHGTMEKRKNNKECRKSQVLAMKRQQSITETSDEDTAEDTAVPLKGMDSHPDLHPPESSSQSSSSLALPLSAMPTSTSASTLLALASPATRRSISMGDFRRVTGALLAGSEPTSRSATAPSSKLVTPSSSMEFEAARRRLLEVEERQRVVREMERRLEELREMFVRSEQQVVVHGELVSRISTSAQQGELYIAENTQRVKKGMKFKKHRPTIVFSSMLGLRTCLPWPVKLK